MAVIVDTSHLNNFCKQIAAVPGLGVTAWNVMLHEVGKILEMCVQRTTRDRVGKIKISIDFKNRTLQTKSGSPIIYFNKAGLGWFADYPGAGNEGIAKGRTVSGKTFHPMTEFFRYGNPRWNRYQQFLIDLKNKQIDVRQVIGRAGNSWVQMGEAAGIRLEGIPSYISAAPGFKGKSGKFGFAAMSKGLWLKMTNEAQILLGTIDGNRILQSSINGRMEYFRQNIKRGVFEDVKQIARAYPSLKVA